MKIFINYVTFLSTDAGRTDGRLRFSLFCPMHVHSIGQTMMEESRREEECSGSSVLCRCCVGYIGLPSSGLLGRTVHSEHLPLSACLVETTAAAAASDEPRRITGLARPSVRLSIPHGLRTREHKSALGKTKR